MSSVLSFSCHFIFAFSLMLLVLMQFNLPLPSSLQRYGCWRLWRVAAAGRAAGCRNWGCVRAATRWEEPPGDSTGRRETSIPHPHPHLARCCRRKSVRHSYRVQPPAVMRSLREFIFFASCRNDLLLYKLRDATFSFMKMIPELWKCRPSIAAEFMSVLKDFT